MHRAGPFLKSKFSKAVGLVCNFFPVLNQPEQKHLCAAFPKKASVFWRLRIEQTDQMTSIPFPANASSYLEAGKAEKLGIYIFVEDKDVCFCFLIQFTVSCNVRPRLDAFPF